MYAISLQPLISLLHYRSTAKQCWFADDATGAGPLEEVKQWWDELRERPVRPLAVLSQFQEVLACC